VPPVAGNGVRNYDYLIATQDMSIVSHSPTAVGSRTGESVRVDIREHVGTMITFEADATEGIQRSLLSQDTTTLERALEQEATNAVADAPVCWVQTNRTGMLVGDPRQTAPVPARPFGPVSRAHTDEVIETALTRSVQRHGRDLSWPNGDEETGDS